MQPPIIVYDLDGTLAYTEVYWLPVVDELFRIVKDRFGYEPAVNETRDVLGYLGRRMEEFLLEIFPDATPEHAREIYQIEHSIWTSDAANFPFELYEGTLEVLEKLHQQGVRQFIASNCQISYLERMLSETGIAPFIEDGICHGHHPKLEKWEFTQLMLQKVDWEGGYFIGDSGSDMKAGRKNGLTTVYAAYGYAPRPATTSIDKEIEDIRQLPGVLGF